jgi:hypothetical protein
MSEQADYFPQYNGSFTFDEGSILYICSCTVPTASCDISVDLISSGCNLPTPTPTLTPTITINGVTPTPTITRTPTLTITPTQTPEIPITYITLYTSYELVSGGTVYDVYDNTTNLIDAQTTYCDISNRELGAQLNGSQHGYYGTIGVGVQLLNSSFNPAINEAGYFNTTFGVVPGVPTGTTYYVRTDSSGIITHYGPMDYCWIDHYAIWSFNFNCPPYQLVGGTSIVLYTDGNSSTWGVGTLVYTDPQLTTYFAPARYIEYQGYIWENDGANGLIEIGIVGDPC